MAVAGRPEDEAVVMGGASLLLGLSVYREGDTYTCSETCRDHRDTQSG